MRGLCAHRRRFVYVVAVVSAVLGLAVLPAASQEQATLELAPDAARAGAVVTASGCGWGGGEVTVLWETEEPIGSGPVDGEGCFEAEVTVPADAQRGQARMFAFDELQGSAEAPFWVVDPKLVLDPPSGVAGTEVDVLGCGWLVEDAVSLHWEPTGETLADELVVDAEGCFQTTVNVPGDAGVGDHDIVGEGARGTSAAAAFSVAAPLRALNVDFPVLVAPYEFRDLSVFDVELTQAIQCFDTSEGLSGCPDNSLTLVTGKWTAARIYLRYFQPFFTSSTLSNVPVRFHVRPAGSSTWTTINTSGTAGSDVDRLDVDVPVAVFRGTSGGSFDIDYFVEVDPNDTISESSNGNNRFPATGVETATLTKARRLDAEGARVNYNPPGYTGTNLPSGWAVNGGGARWMERILPVEGIDYGLQSGSVPHTESLSASGQHNLIGDLNSRWMGDQTFNFSFLPLRVTVNDPDPDHLYGWVTDDVYTGGHADMPVYPHAGGYGVVGIGTDTPGTSTEDPDRGAVIMGHEVVHDYDVFHTNTGDACGSSDSSSDFPYSSSSIQEVGFDPVSRTVYDPASTHDVMSYCPPGSQDGWITPFTWEKMFDQLAARGSDGVRIFGSQSQATTQQAATSDEALLINATLQREGGGSLDTLYRVDAPVEPTDSDGNFAVELRDQADGVVARRNFEATFEGEYDGTSHPGEGFEQIDTALPVLTMPYYTDTVRVVLLDGDGQELDTRAVSANNPTVNVDDPSFPETWDPGTEETVAWTGDDADGDELTYTVLFRHDPLSTWQTLAENITDTQLVVPVDDLAGGDVAQFRVIASDGVNTGMDDSAQVFVPSKDPVPEIGSPGPDARFAAGEPAILQGGAIDLEDGAVPPAGLAWASDRDGELGTGADIAVDPLSPGTHELTLTASDSDGQTGTDTVTIHVPTVGDPEVDPETSEDGEAVTATAAIDDPGPAPDDGYACTVDYGDGDGPQDGTAAGGSCTGPQHIYEFPGDYSVAVDVRLDGQPIGSSTGMHTVERAAGSEVVRLAGSNRFATAAAISRDSFEPGVPVAYVATGQVFADALSGGPAAALRGGPILLVTRDLLPADTRDELQRLDPEQIVVLGGSAAVSDAVRTELDGLTDGGASRLAGPNRFATAAAISRDSFEPGVPVAYVATGQVFADALSGGPAAALRGGPILLVTRDLLPADTRDELQRLDPERIVVLGGSAAVSDAVRTELDGLTDGGASRLQGPNRFATAAAISADTFPADALQVAYVATGTEFADALAGGPSAARRSASLVLATSGHLPEATRAELERLAPKRIVVLGGTAAISDDLLGELAELTRDS